MKNKKFSSINASLSGSQYLSDLSYNRLFVIGFVFVAAFFLVALKLCLITFSSNIGEANALTNKKSLFVHRKEILDRNGALLAVNLASASLYAKPKYIFEPEEVAKKLVNIFSDLSYTNLVAEFKSNKNFIWIKRNITPKEQYAVNNLGIPGLDFEKNEKRLYLQGNILSHILGYVDVDGTGISGLEKTYNKFLSNNLDDKNKLELSIDVRVQTIVHEALSTAMTRYRADGAAGIVMDVTSGEIYAMVSMPDFDPHNPNKAKPDQIFNRASLGMFELGSIFKVCTMAMALENKSSSLNDVYYVKDPIRASKFQINDYHSTTNWLSMPEIFMHSSNIGTARIALGVGSEKQKKFLKKFGLLDKLSVEISEKGTPIIPDSARWNEISTMTISYGHGIAISPLHFAQVTSALVNGGYMYPATLIKYENNKDDTQIERIISEETSANIRKLMRLTVTDGSGRLSEVKGYLVGGKTGTADKAKKGGYHTNSKISSFVAAFPMNDPKFVIMLMVDNPKAEVKSTTIAGRAVAPIAKEIIEKIGPILGVKPVNEYDESIRKKLHLEYKTDIEVLESF